MKTAGVSSISPCATARQSLREKRAACSSASPDAEESWPVVCAELLSLQNYISGRT
jgi:hypothetical protein